MLLVSVSIVALLARISPSNRTTSALAVSLPVPADVIVEIWASKLLIFEFNSFIFVCAFVIALLLADVLVLFCSISDELVSSLLLISLISLFIEAVFVSIESILFVILDICVAFSPIVFLSSLIFFDCDSPFSSLLRASRPPAKAPLTSLP